MELAIRKSTGLDDVLARIKPQAVEERKPLTQQNNQLSEAISEYFQLLSTSPPFKDLKGLLQELTSCCQILTPTEIQQFLQQTVVIRRENQQRAREEHSNDLTGLYVTALIQESFNFGHNNFSLGFSDSYFPDWLGHRLSGKEGTFFLSSDGSGWRLVEERKYLNLSIRGNLGWYNFSIAKFLRLKLDCPVIGDSFAFKTQSCYFDLGRERTEWRPLHNSEAFRSQSTPFAVSVRGTVITSNSSNYEWLKKFYSQYSDKGSNVLILTNASGSELERYKF